MFTEVPLGPSAVVWSSQQEGPRRIPADGCVDVIASGDSIHVCGPQTRWLRATGSDHEGLLGLRLAAGTALALLPTDHAGLRDEVVDLTAALGNGAVPLRDRLLCARGPPEPHSVLAPLIPSETAPPWVLGVRSSASCLTGLP